MTAISIVGPAVPSFFTVTEKEHAGVPVRHVPDNRTVFGDPFASMATTSVFVTGAVDVQAGDVVDVGELAARRRAEDRVALRVHEEGGELSVDHVSIIKPMLPEGRPPGNRTWFEGWLAVPPFRRRHPLLRITRCG